MKTLSKKLPFCHVYGQLDQTGDRLLEELKMGTIVVSNAYLLEIRLSPPAARSADSRGVTEVEIDWNLSCYLEEDETPRLDHRERRARSIKSLVGDETIGGHQKNDT